MSALKTFALWTLVGAASIGTAQAAPITATSWKWTTWYQGRGNARDQPASGPAVARANGSTTIAGVPESTAGFAPTAPVPTAVLAATSTMPVAPLTSTPTPSAPATAPIAAPTPAPRMISADALIDMGAPPYAEEGVLTRGGAAPWYESPVVRGVYGGTPSVEQQAAFSQQVLDKVQQTYSLSGISPKLTLDPSVPTAHTLSVVSGTSYGQNEDAIGISDVGGSGFSFVDKLGGVKSVDELSWAVAHNVAHELLHAWGMGDHPDNTGNYIDSATASWTMLTDPNSKISPAAISELLAGDSGLAQRLNGGWAAQLVGWGDGASPQPVPEPSVLAFWSIAAVGVVARRYRAA